MNADVYLVDADDNDKEYYIGNFEISTPEERAKKKEDCIDFLKSVGADIEYMKQHGCFGEE